MTKLEERLNWNTSYETETQREKRERLTKQSIEIMTNMILKVRRFKRPTLGNICIKI